MRTVPLALAALAVLASAPLRAQDKPVGPQAPAADKPAEKPAEKKSAPVSAGADGFSVQNESGEYKLQLRGYTHFDGRFFGNDDAGVATDNFLLRRVRPILQGSVGRYFDFNLTPDFGGGNAVIQDAWLEFRPSGKVKVRVGKFKSPVGLERLQSATAIHFVERAFPSALLPVRDVGIQIHGDLAGGTLSYAAAFVNGAPDGGSVDSDTNDGKDLAGRLFFSPFKRGDSILKDLGVGLAGTTGTQTGPLPAYRSGGQISVISVVTGVVADGTRTRYSPQLSFYAGRFGLLGEYAQSTSRVKTADGTRHDYEARAWQVTATLALTGDKASYSGLRPAKPFDPSKGQWGALELAGRIHHLEIDGEALLAGIVDAARSAREIDGWGLGLSWSLTRNVKQMVDFNHVSFEGGDLAGADRPSENVIFIRTQVSF